MAKARKRPSSYFMGLFLVSILVLFSGFANCKSSEEGDNHWKKQRQQMVHQQIRARDVEQQKVINAMKSVPRHKFVPEQYKSISYSDRPLPIGEDQTISQPYIVAYMTEAIDPAADDKILEIGTGSGYQAAVLAELCKTVYTVEIRPVLAREAKQRLRKLGYKNVHVKIGDGYKGWKEHSPYDKIIVTCSPEEIPQPLINQLKEGGKMIIPVGKGYNQQLYLLEKNNGDLEKNAVLPVRFVPMVDEQEQSY